MPKLTALITHAYIHTLPKEKAKELSIYAYIDLCFGPGDDNIISGIRYQKSGNEFVFAGPVFYKFTEKGEKETTPVFKGAMLHELSTMCAIYMDQVKKLGRFDHGKKYRVTIGSAVEITENE